MFDTLFDIETPATPATTTPRATYVDPHPGKHGDDIIREECGPCRGTGYYNAPSGLNIINPHTKKPFKGHFECNGYGYTDRKVKNIRAAARRAVKATNAWIDGQEAREAAAAAEAILEYAREWDAAHAEQARRAALVTGYVADIGAKVKNLPGTVTVAARFEVPSYRGYGIDTKALIVVTLENGQVVKTVGTGGSLYSVEKGDTVTISGTVKDHKVYNGQDQTVLTRAKIA